MGGPADGSGNPLTFNANTCYGSVSPSVPVITSALTASGTVGTAFSYQITATNSPANFNATGLPAGLSVNSSNGLISGTPTTAGTFNVTISATNAGGTGTRTLALTVNAAGTATYYIDFAGGNDANNGTSKSTPWKRAPGMQGCGGNCAAIIPKPGDSIIFKGGVTWDSTCWSWVLPSSGSSGNPITYGVDKTWFIGGSWTRPIFDAQWTSPTADSLLRVLNVGWLTFDNIEMKNLLARVAGGPSMILLDGVGNILITNCYLHGWTLPAAITADGTHGGIYSTVPTGPVTVDHCLISNTEYSSTRNNGGAIAGADVVSFSTIHDVSSLCLGCATVHDSTMYNIGYPVSDFDPAFHTNGIYQIGNGAVYNNLIYNFNANAAPIYPNPCSGGGGPNQDWTQYVYNNVVWVDNTLASGAPLVDVNPEVASGNGFCGTVVMNNNTFQSSGNSAIRTAEWNTGPGANWRIKNFTFENNHIINGAGSDSTCFTTGNSCGAPQTMTKSNNIFMSNAAANTQGYVGGNAYAPTAIGNSTVGAGLNLTSSCAWGLASLCRDASVGGARTPNARPAGGAWDAGAYQFAGAPPPAPVITSVWTAYDTVQDRIVGWSGGDTVYLYNPDTDSCTSVTYSNGPGAQQALGTYGRFRYFPALNVFALVNDVNQNAYALRLTNGTPPPPPPPSSSPCDVNGDGTTNVADVQLEVNMALGVTPCTNPSGTCTVVSVQRLPAGRQGWSMRPPLRRGGRPPRSSGGRR